MQNPINASFRFSAQGNRLNRQNDWAVIGRNVFTIILSRIKFLDVQLGEERKKNETKLCWSAWKRFDFRCQQVFYCCFAGVFFLYFAVIAVDAILTAALRSMFQNYFVNSLNFAAADIWLKGNVLTWSTHNLLSAFGNCKNFLHVFLSYSLLG